MTCLATCPVNNNFNKISPQPKSRFNLNLTG